ncbi:hypothetical protein [Rhizobium sp. LC145]|uniref:hypothetical protein n=1 Tax=Rhizobium sp. LC145 TaxID=1120688 RepID=UPI000A594BDB|nr:hypothetical protein [Rhizobium sp. LC145]
MPNILRQCRRMILPRFEAEKDFRGSTIILHMCIALGLILLLAFLLTRLATAI